MELCNNKRVEFIEECISALCEMCDNFNYFCSKYKACGLDNDFYRCTTIILSIKKVLRVLKRNNIEFELTTENELFTTIKLKDVNKPKTIHVATLERG